VESIVEGITVVKSPHDYLHLTHASHL
jgi:hypothetical protein